MFARKKSQKKSVYLFIYFFKCVSSLKEMETMGSNGEERRTPRTRKRSHEGILRHLDSVKDKDLEKSGDSRMLQEKSAPPHPHPQSTDSCRNSSTITSARASSQTESIRQVNLKVRQVGDRRSSGLNYD